jgi:hypothetical protein
VDINLFECIYSPAKRRGPVPGRSGQSRKANEAFGTPRLGSAANGSMDTGGGGGPSDWSQAAASMTGMPPALRQMMLQNMGAVAGMGGLGAAAVTSAEPSFFDSQQAAIQQQLNLIQQLQAQQNANERNLLGGGGMHNAMVGGAELREPAAQKIKLEQPKQTESTDCLPHTLAGAKRSGW